MKTLPCLSYEGCRGTGAHWDPTDSGSGAEVYCDCPAGVALKAAEAVPVSDAEADRICAAAGIDVEAELQRVLALVELAETALLAARP